MEAGNVKAMREALVKIREKCVIYNNDLAEEIDAICGNALALPRRQCDVGTAEEQSVRMSEFCREQHKKTDGVALCSGCRFHNIEGLECQFAWAQMPYEAEEGAGK